MGIFDKLFGPPTKDNFARMVMDGIRKAGETAKLQYDRDQFLLRLEEGDGPIIYLGNGFQEFSTAPKEVQEKVVQKWVRHWFIGERKLPEDFSDVHPDLLPAFRARSYFELTRLRLKLEGNKAVDWPYEVLGERFGVSLVYDLPDSMQSITQENLDAWGVTFFEALEAAKQNFKELQHPFMGPKEGPGLYLSAAKDNYDASRIILGEIIQQFEVQGDCIAMIPSRSTLLVAGSEDLDSLKAMLGIAQEALNEPWHILGIALRLDGDTWVPWLPEPSHPLFKDFKTLYLQSVGQDYAEQKELLDKLHEKTGTDVFVASFTGMKNEKTGLVVSYSVWSKGVLALLPRTDLLAFIGPDQEPVMVPWERAEEVVGDLMEPVDIYPPRWKVEAFPTKEQLKMMGEGS